MPQLHLFQELSHKIGFEVKHSIVFVVTRNDCKDSLLELVRSHIAENPEEFFEEQSGHIVGLKLQCL